MNEVRGIYKIIISNGFETKEYTINLKRPLLKLGEIYDEIIFSKDDTVIVRKIGISDFGVPYELIKPIVDRTNYLPKIEFLDGDNKIEILDFNGDVYCKYLFKNKLNDTFASKLELENALKVTEEGVLAKSWKKTEVDELVSAINLTPGKVDITGTVTANENVKIHEDGTLEAINGKFSGEIIAEKGTIGNLILENNELRYTSPLTLYDYTFSDVAKCKKIIMGEKEATDFEKYLYDVNDNGEIDILDLLIIKKYVLGYLTNEIKKTYAVITIGTTDAEIKTQVYSENGFVGKEIIINREKIITEMMDAKNLSSEAIIFQNKMLKIREDGLLEAVDI